MKIFTTLLLVLLISNSYSQTNVDLLKKYSYPILGFDVAAVKGGATCFFIRYNKKIYIVTAKHVLNGCLNDSTKDVDSNKKSYIFLGNYSQSIFLNTNDTKKFLPCKGTDLVFCQLLDTSMGKYINSVEDFMVPEFKNYVEFIICGYPSSTYNKDMFKHLPPSSFMEIHDSTFKIFDIVNSKGVRDSTAYAINWKGKIVKDSLIGGYSGSPVFIQEKNTLKWRLAGILTAAKDLGIDEVSIMIIDSKTIVDKLMAPQVPYMSQGGVLYIY